LYVAACADCQNLIDLKDELACGFGTKKVSVLIEMFTLNKAASAFAMGFELCCV
jgi:hypothetical protein